MTNQNNNEKKHPKMFMIKQNMKKNVERHQWKQNNLEQIKKWM
jgi:hypothetical protein